MTTVASPRHRARVRAPAAPIRIVPLHRDTPEAWALMPAALARVTRFCEQYDTDTRADVMCAAIRQHFIADDADSKIRVLVAVRDGHVVGHLVVSLDPWCGQTHATIVQYETDVALPRALVRDTLDELAWWAERQGAATLRLWALATDDRAAARARAFRAYGFEAHRLAMRRRLGG